MTPLSDLVVLDLTRLLPGAYATLVLADMGASVIKIEDRGHGDPIRSMPPLAGGSSAYHRVLNRNKRSVTLNLRAPDAARVLDALASRADVLVESFRPQTARRLGVDAPAVCARHPRLVHCAITGFGQSGPYAERPGHDLNYVALAGLLALDREPGEPPRMPRMFVADIGGGAMHAVCGILAALVQRAATGRGAAVDVSMYEGALAWLSVPAARVLRGERDDEGPADLPITGREACYNVYRTADDRYVALGALEPKFWRRFCEHVGRPDWIPRQFDSGPSQEALLAAVRELFRARSLAEWMRWFDTEEVCLTRVNTVAEALDDPHARARGAVESHDGTRVLRPGVRVASDRTGWPPVEPAPDVGAHTDEVLAAAGFDAAAIRRFREDRVV